MLQIPQYFLEPFIIQKARKATAFLSTLIWVLTFLYQDHLGGLEVQTQQTWLEVPPVSGSFVINLGDMLEYVSRGILRATKHRVKNTSNKDRLSIPLFYDPNWDCLLNPIKEELLNADMEKKIISERWDGIDLHASDWKGKTYGDYVWNKIKDVFPELSEEI